MKLNARQLRTIEAEDCPQPAKRLPIYLIADRLYKVFNLGGLFRLADAIAASHFFIGGTELEINGKLRSASSGTYKVVDWSSHESTETAIFAARQKIPNLTVLAVEQASGKFSSVDYRDCLYRFPVALVLGNETTGVSEKVKEMVDGMVEIPLHGVNSSLNVIVAASIVAYEAIRRL